MCILLLEVQIELLCECYSNIVDIWMYTEYFRGNLVTFPTCFNCWYTINSLFTIYI